MPTDTTVRGEAQVVCDLAAVLSEYAELAGAIRRPLDRRDRDAARACYAVGLCLKGLVKQLEVEAGVTPTSFAGGTYGNVLRRIAAECDREDAANGLVLEDDDTPLEAVEPVVVVTPEGRP